MISCRLPTKRNPEVPACGWNPSLCFISPDSGKISTNNIRTFRLADRVLLAVVHAQNAEQV